MKFNAKQKEKLKLQLIACLGTEKEIKKIIIFGSFLSSSNPNDIDVAIFQDSTETYLTLAMKYRKKTRNVSRAIPLDIIPLKSNIKNNPLLSEIETGELIYRKDSTEIWLTRIIHEVLPQRHQVTNK